MKKRDIRIDYVRAIAVLMMILQHVCIFLHRQNITVTYMSAILIEVIMLITKSAVPLFVIITGSVLLDEEKNFPLQKGIKLSWKMIKIIVVWNIISAIYFYFNDGLKTSLDKLIYGNYWYLYMLVALYLLMPIVNLMTKNYKITKIPVYIIALTLIYEFWLSYSLVIPGEFYGYDSRLVNKLQLSLITGYTGFLLLGFIIKNDCSNINLDSIKAKIITLSITILMLGLLIYAIFIAVKDNEYNYIYFDEFTAFLIGGIVFYIFQKLKIPVLKTKNIHRSLVCWCLNCLGGALLFIGTHSLGMYVVSNLFLDICKRISISIEIFPNIIIGIIICWLMIIIPSFIIVWLLSKTPLNKII